MAPTLRGHSNLFEKKLIEQRFAVQISGKKEDMNIIAPVCLRDCPFNDGVPRPGLPLYEAPARLLLWNHSRRQVDIGGRHGPGFVGGQKGCRLRHVIQCGQSPEHRRLGAAAEPLVDRQSQSTGLWCKEFACIGSRLRGIGNRMRAQTNDTNVARPQFCCQNPGKGLYACAGDTVAQMARRCRASGRRREREDDALASLAHMRHHRLAAVEQRGQEILYRTQEGSEIEVVDMGALIVQEAGGIDRSINA